MTTGSGQPRGRYIHRSAVVRAEKAHALFGDFGQLQERDHLEAGVPCQLRSSGQGVRSATNPPLSVRIL